MSGSGITFRSPNETQTKQLKNYWGKNYEPYLIASPGNCMLPIQCEKYAEKIFNFDIRNDDIFALAWTKTGSTWMQELVWSVVNYENIDIAGKISVSQRVPLLETDMVIERLQSMKGESYDGELFLTKFEAMKSPRIFKSHLPHCLLPPKLLDNCKVVACLRNPKDTLISLYHYYEFYRPAGSDKKLEEVFDLFIDDLLPYSPYWDAVLDQWNKKEHPNMCLLFYEDMKRDLAGSIRKVAEFLQRDMPDSTVRDLVDRLSFKKMNEDAQEEKSKQGNMEGAIAPVFRKGQIGDWRSHLTKEMNDRMDKVITEKFKGTGLHFSYEWLTITNVALV